METISTTVEAVNAALEIKRRTSRNAQAAMHLYRDLGGCGASLPAWVSDAVVLDAEATEHLQRVCRKAV